MPDVLAVITVPFDPSELSLNRRLHWRTRHRLNCQAKAAALWGWREAGEPKAIGPVSVRLIVRRGRAIDPDNALAGMKPVIDFLFSEGRLTPSDSQKWVRYDGVTFEVGGAWRGKEEVVVICERRSEP